MSERIPTRVAYGKTLVEIGERDERLIVFEADIAKSTNTFRFGDRFPARFFNVGAAEMNLIDMAAGASTTGLIPFASTFAMFASLRAAEAVRQSVCYARRNVKIVASNAGVEICGDGPSHQAVEDLAAMRVMANLTVLAPCDAATTRAAALWAFDYDGPVYMRLGRQAAKQIHPADVDWRVGKMMRLREGRDVTLIALGNMVEQALLAAEALAREGIEARVLDCHTVKPLDREAVIAAAEETRAIVTAEDHSVIGGLGAAVCEVTAEARPATVRRVGLRDRFASSGHDFEALMRHYGLDAATIVKTAKEALEAAG